MPYGGLIPWPTEGQVGGEGFCARRARCFSAASWSWSFSLASTHPRARRPGPSHLRRDVWAETSRSQRPASAEAPTWRLRRRECVFSYVVQARTGRCPPPYRCWTSSPEDRSLPCGRLRMMTRSRLSICLFRAPHAISRRRQRGALLRRVRRDLDRLRPHSPDSDREWSVVGARSDAGRCTDAVRTSTRNAS